MKPIVLDAEESYIRFEMDIQSASVDHIGTVYLREGVAFPINAETYGQIIIQARRCPWIAEPIEQTWGHSGKELERWAAGPEVRYISYTWKMTRPVWAIERGWCWQEDDHLVYRYIESCRWFDGFHLIDTEFPEGQVYKAITKHLGRWDYQGDAIEWLEGYLQETYQNDIQKRS